MAPHPALPAAPHARRHQILGYALRPSSASPAVGYLSLHNEQQKEVVDAAFREIIDNYVLPVQGAGKAARDPRNDT